MYNVLLSRTRHTMHVILSVQSIHPPLTGIGRYAFELAQRLPLQQDVETLRLMSGPRQIANVESLVTGPSTLQKIKRWVPFKPLLRRLYYAGRNAGSAQALTSLGQHYVYHEPSYILGPYDGPSVATVHDLSHMHYPEFHPASRVEYLSRELPRTIERATHLITVSEFVRQEMIDILGISPDKVTAVLNGVDERFVPMSPAQTLAVRRRYELDDVDYLLVVATLEPRKNLGRLLSAYAGLPEAVRRRHPLVVVGARGWRDEALNQQLERMIATGDVRKLGYVHDDDLPALYAGAHSFTYPSVYEGFGLPVLEAMACGIPVMTSQASSMPEVLGDTGLAVDPLDVDAMREGLRKLLEDDEFRAFSAKAGPQRAKGLGWDKCVAETVQVYRKIAP